MNIVLALVLFDALGVPGLALAFSGAYAVAAVVTLGVLRAGASAGSRGRGIGSSVVARRAWSRAVAGGVGVARGRRDRVVDDPGEAIVLGRGLGGGAAAFVPPAGSWLLRVERVPPSCGAPRPGAAAERDRDALGESDPAVRTIRAIRQPGRSVTCGQSGHRQRVRPAAGADRRARHRGRPAHDPVRRRGARRPRGADHRASSGTGCAPRAVLPETAAPSAGAFEERFRDLIAARRHRHRVHQPVVAPLRDDAGRAGRGQRRSTASCPVEVIDSLTCSMGLGALCLTAARRGRRRRRRSRRSSTR